MRIASSLFLLCGLAATPAMAADDIACKYDGTQQEMNACAFRDYQTADRALNRTYRKVMGTLPAAEQKPLRLQQRRWLKQRHPTCEARTEEEKGGSIWPLSFHTCLQHATERRTREIARWKALR
jgi:uncharacterized protein YecT (DUF1311 family)